ncbi:MAG: penicillin-binding protein 2 [Candidatus Omnitrophota bacterium]
MARVIPKKRSVVVYSFFVLCFLVITARIVNLQVFRSSFYRKLAQGQHYRLLKIQGRRGTIFDRKDRTLAAGLYCYSVFADPSLISDLEASAKIISQYTGLSQETLLSRLKKGKRFIWIKRKISLRERQELAALNLEGIGFIREQKRFYPHNTVGAALLGLVDIDNKGLEGLEFFYHQYLSGKDGKVKILQDSSLRKIIFSSGSAIPQAGADLVLTVDAQIQYWVEEILEKTVKKFRAQDASAVIMDASNGEILALANYPSFNANALNQEDLKYLKNRVVVDMFEPGSVFKVVTLLAALNEKIFSPDEIIFCENGEFKIPGSILHDWHAYGKLTFEEVFMKSSNIGVAKIASSLGAQTLYQYIQRLEFGRPTGIDFPGEVSGWVKNQDQWSKTSGFIIPIGQEIGVNLLQLARTLAVVANGGYLVKPHLVKKICSYGYCKDSDYSKKQVFSPEVTEEAKRILIKVVQEGTGKSAGVSGRLIGGKTGTAQKYDPDIGRYSPNDYRATFVGFIADLDHPLVIAVSVDEPRASHFGGVVAAPAFKEISEKTIAYLEGQNGIE